MGAEPLKRYNLCSSYFLKKGQTLPAIVIIYVVSSWNLKLIKLLTRSVGNE